MKFNLKNFIIFLLIFISEICIAKTSGFIRHTFGDYLVVILLYYLVKSFFDIHYKKLAVGVLLFSFLVELLQAINFIELLDLKHNKIARLIIGTTFSLGDLVAYTLGIITILAIEKHYEKTH